VSPLQAWLVVGLPALAIVAGMFARRSPTMSAIGYLVLAATFVFFLTYVDDTISAASLGTVAFLLVASGRGGAAELAPVHDDVVPDETRLPARD